MSNRKTNSTEKMLLHKHSSKIINRSALFLIKKDIKNLLSILKESLKQYKKFVKSCALNEPIF